VSQELLLSFGIYSGATCQGHRRESHYVTSWRALFSSITSHFIQTHFEEGFV
jgi:hypothetical protein